MFGQSNAFGTWCLCAAAVANSVSGACHACQGRSSKTLCALNAISLCPVLHAGFGQPAQQQQNAFGAPSPFGGAQSQPAFGANPFAAATPATPAFGAQVGGIRVACTRSSWREDSIHQLHYKPPFAHLCVHLFSQVRTVDQLRVLRGVVLHCSLRPALERQVRQRLALQIQGLDSG